MIQMLQNSDILSVIYSNTYELSSMSSLTEFSWVTIWKASVVGEFLFNSNEFATTILWWKLFHRTNWLEFANGLKDGVGFHTQTFKIFLFFKCTFISRQILWFTELITTLMIWMLQSSRVRLLHWFPFLYRRVVFQLFNFYYVTILANSAAIFCTHTSNWERPTSYGGCYYQR